MRKNLFIFIILIPVYSLLARGKLQLNVGPTISYFVDAENSSPLIGFSVRMQMRVLKYKNFAISTGIGYSTRGVLLKHRSIAPYAPFPMKAYFWDIYGRIGYLEMPILLQIKIPVHSKISLNISGGPALTLPWKDLSKLKRREFFDMYDLHGSDDSRFDFIFAQESTFGNNLLRFIYEIGIELQYQRYGLKFLYLINKQKEYYFDSLWGVNHKMNSFSLVFTIKF